MGIAQWVPWKETTMIEFAHRCLRRYLACYVRLVFCVIATTLLTLGPSAAGTASMVVRVVHNDRGGVVRTRAQEIADIQMHHQRVEIRGRVCLSTCTMYLGAGNVCVSPKTKFGFHGPSYYGRPLKPHQFEYWSQVIASYYPANLRDWYLSTGRYKAEGYYTMTGAQLIQMGVARC